MSEDPPGSPEGAGASLVARWIEAYNGRDIETMLACVTEGFELHQLRPEGDTDFAYVGHEGLRLWLDELKASGSRHQLRVAKIPKGETHEVSVSGSVDVPGQSPVADFQGVYEISGGLIVRARHWIGDGRTMEELGLIGSD
jgi:hypothetical protein